MRPSPPTSSRTTPSRMRTRRRPSATSSRATRPDLRPGRRKPPRYDQAEGDDISDRTAIEDAETRVMPVSDGLPPAQDGGVEDDAHRRAAAEAAARPAPKLCDGIELIGVYEGSGFKEPPYIARRADGQVVQMPKLLYLLAEEIDGQKNDGEIAERVSEKFQRGLDAEMVEMLVAEKLAPLGVAQAPDGSQPELQKIDP